MNEQRFFNISKKKNYALFRVKFKVTITLRATSIIRSFIHLFRVKFKVTITLKARSIIRSFIHFLGVKFKVTITLRATSIVRSSKISKAFANQRGKSLRGRCIFEGKFSRTLARNNLFPRR